MPQIYCKTCHTENILLLEHLKDNENFLFCCFNCGPLFSSYTFSFRGKELVDLSFNLRLRKVYYTVYSSRISNDCAVFADKRRLLLEYNKFFDVDFSGNINKQFAGLIRKAEKLKNFK